MTESNEPRVTQAVTDNLRAQMEAQADDTTPSSIMRDRGLVWLEGWFDIDAALTTAQAEAAALKQWRDAVDDALVCAHLGTWESFPDAKTALHRLICWETEVALDPAVSQAARDLLDRQAAALKAENEALRAQVEGRIVAWLRHVAEAAPKPFGLVDDYSARWALKHAADNIESGFDEDDLAALAEPRHD